MNNKTSPPGKIKSYQKSFRKYGNDPRALQWSSAKAAEIRYEQIVKDINFEGKTILDVGCGFGDLIHHLEKKAKNFIYTGIDIVPEFIEVSKRKFPKHKFITGDCFGQPLTEKFDIIVTSGTLNANVKKAMEIRKAAIATMFEKANEAIVFNMAGGHPQPKSKTDGRVFYADSLEVLEYCLSLTNKVILRQDYHPKDFTIAMFK